MRKGLRVSSFKPPTDHFEKMVKSEADRTNAEYKHWVNIVKAMYGYRCAICTEREKLEVHHIESFTKNEDVRTDISNGVVLCKKHHKEYHRKYGEATKQNWENFKKEKAE